MSNGFHHMVLTHRILGLFMFCSVSVQFDTLFNLKPHKCFCFKSEIHSQQHDNLDKQLDLMYNLSSFISKTHVQDELIYKLEHHFNKFCS